MTVLRVLLLTWNWRVTRSPSRGVTVRFSISALTSISPPGRADGLADEGDEQAEASVRRSRSRARSFMGLSMQDVASGGNPAAYFRAFLGPRRTTLGLLNRPSSASFR